MSRSRIHPRGFTLLETLVAIGILAGLLLVITTLVRDVSDSRRRTEARMQEIEGATVALDVLAGRLTVATAFDATGGSGIVGDATSLRVTGSGVSIRRLASGSGLSPLVDRTAVELRLESEGLAIREDGDARSVLVPGMFAVRFRYHDGRNWRDSWDSGIDGLPVAVESRFWFEPWTEGRRPDWMAFPEDEIGFGDSLEPFDDADAGEFAEFEDLDQPAPASVAVAMEDAPPADRIRVVALLDPVPLQDDPDALDDVPMTEDRP